MHLTQIQAKILFLAECVKPYCIVSPILNRGYGGSCALSAISVSFLQIVLRFHSATSPILNRGMGENNALDTNSGKNLVFG